MVDTFTANLGLLIADLNDTFNFGAHVEANYTTIDGLMGAVQCTSGTRPTNTYAGQIIYETDSQRYVQNTGTKASPAWTYMSHQAYAAASSARPTVGLTAGQLLYETDNLMVRPRGASAWLSNLPTCTSSARPTNPVTGDMAVETDTGRVIWWSGSAWQQKTYGEYVCTSSTHPSSPFTGLEIFETDTGLSAVYSGSNYLYGMQQLATTQTLSASAASITFSSIPAVNTLIGVYLLRTDTGSGGAFATMRLNGDTGNDYTWQVIYASGTTTNAANAGGLVSSMRFAIAPGSGDTANYFASGQFDIAGASGSTYKVMSSTTSCGVSASNSWAGVMSGLWQNTAAVTSITLLPSAGNFVAGSKIALYGSM